MVNKSHHVVPAENGWRVRKGGAERASKRFDLKDEAILYARKVSKNQHSELYIHKRDGTVQSKEGYSRDTNLPKDKK